MKSRKMYASAWVLLLIVPLGLAACLFIFDYCFGIYEQKKLDKTTEEVMYEVLNRDGLTTLEDYKEFAIKLFKEKGYEVDDLSFVLFDENNEDESQGYILSNYHRYLDMVGTISFNLIRSDTDMVHSSYYGYYNDYKEAVVEKYVESDEEDLIIE